MSRRPIILLHGYSAEAKSMHPWRQVLLDHGFDAAEIRLGQYISLSNEITIKDVAEGFDRALRATGGLGDDQDFDVIVHSTGGLVIREWLTSYEARRARVKHIIGLAPAMFGSPIAHQGRSLLGAVFKGQKDVLSPDFVEAGNQVLSGLELGSSYTWKLAERDLLGSEPTYGTGPDTPWPFVFIGSDNYGGLRNLFTNPDGSDGTVRWSAAGLNTRKFVVDLRRTPGDNDPPRLRSAPWSNINAPLVFIDGANHGTIVSDPPDKLLTMVLEALEVEDFDAYQTWAGRHADTPRGMTPWQQFVVRLTDERDDPVRDYYLDIGTLDDGQFDILDHFAMDVHPYTDDPSYRCFHVNLGELKPEDHKTLALRLIADSGSELIAYRGTKNTLPGADSATDAKWTAQLNLTPGLQDHDERFFYPYTTTLLHIMVNREPTPAAGASQLLSFVDANA